MTGAFLWGLVAGASLVVGGLIALWLDIGKRTLGAIMAFGAGVLISAVAYELVFEAVQISEVRGPATLGFFSGALTFFVADWLIGRMGGADRKGIEAIRNGFRWPTQLIVSGAIGQSSRWVASRLWNFSSANGPGSSIIA